MNISGNVEFAASAERAQNAFRRREQLAHFLTRDSKLEERPDGSFDFTAQKDFGPVSIRLPGVLTVSSDPKSDALLFKAQASHVLAGSADLNMMLIFSGNAEHCKITYDGTLDATGLAGKVLGMGAEKVQSRLRLAFEAFGKRMERSRKAQKARES